VERTLYSLAGDFLLLLHLGFVAFVVGGLVLVWLGWWRRWEFVRNRRFRVLHLAAMGLVLGQSVLGMICPLTTLENWLRAKAGEGARYRGTFVEYWVGRLMYYDASLMTFIIAYAAFFALMVASWWWVPPRGRRN
jgi:hypothetical protein